ncbi:MAG: hypothetical protein JXA42_09975 [Anaerolineales bacterium]|nr:hypothetical protein [Anaerolineales bacterium]
MKVLTVIAFTILGLILENGFFYLSETGIFVRWKSLGIPPDGGMEILGSGGIDVYIKTTTGKVYVCSMPKRRNCWEETEWPPKVMQWSEPVEDDIFWVSRPPDNVIDSIAVGDFAFDHIGEAKYVLLQNGSVWRWYHVKSELPFMPSCNTGMGMSAGFLFGIMYVMNSKDKKTDCTD